MHANSVITSDVYSRQTPDMHSTDLGKSLNYLVPILGEEAMLIGHMQRANEIYLSSQHIINVDEYWCPSLDSEPLCFLLCYVGNV